MNIPSRTRDLISDVTQNFPKTPYQGAKAIQGFLESNFEYGADENIAQGKWARFPHQIKHMANCNDFGIFAYFLAEKLGLDATLLRSQWSSRAGQTHLQVVIRGSENDYLIDRDRISGILKPLRKQDNWKTEEAKKALENAEYIFVPEILENIRVANEPKGVLNFLRTGQMLSSYYLTSKDFNPGIPAEIRRAFLHNGALMERKTFHLPGIYLHQEHKGRGLEILLSGGMDNLDLERVVPLASYTHSGQEKKGKWKLRKNHAERLGPRRTRKILDVLYSLKASAITLNLVFESPEASKMYDKWVKDNKEEGIYTTDEEIAQQGIIMLGELNVDKNYLRRKTARDWREAVNIENEAQRYINEFNNRDDSRKGNQQRRLIEKLRSEVKLAEAV